MKKYFLLVGFLLGLVTQPSAYAGLTIEITSGVDNPTPVAVVPFANSTGLPEDLQQIVSDDLRYSGLFRPIPKTDMLSFPKAASEVFYRDWRALGASYLVTGMLDKVETGYILKF